MERLGILGGSFDPPHQGHLAVAEAALQQLALEHVLWVPAGSPPHKHHQTPVEHRLAMTELIIAGRPHFTVCRLDIDRPGPHYTADLLALVQKQYGPETQIWFLVGEDSLRDLASWYTPGRILQACRLAVYPRHGPPIDWEQLSTLVPGIQQKTDWLAGPSISMASRSIRNRLARGEPLPKSVPPVVQRYIQEHHLYRARGS